MKHISSNNKIYLIVYFLSLLEKKWAAERALVQEDQYAATVELVKYEQIADHHDQNGYEEEDKTDERVVDAL